MSEPAAGTEPAAPPAEETAETEPKDEISSLKADVATLTELVNKLIPKADPKPEDKPDDKTPKYMEKYAESLKASLGDSYVKDWDKLPLQSQITKMEVAKELIGKKLIKPAGNPKGKPADPAPISAAKIRGINYSDLAKKLDA